MHGTEAFDRLNRRLQTILPQEYQDLDESLQPVSMGSAGLKYDMRRPGRMGSRSGEPSATSPWPADRRTRARCSSRRERGLDAAPDRYAEVAEEICRGIRMVDGPRARTSR